MLEMLLVLSILSICFLIIPKKANNAYTLRQKVDYVKAVLLQNQCIAMQQHQQRRIMIYEDQIVCEDQVINLSPLHCDGTSFHYTPIGSISQAQTIHFKYGNKRYDLVLQLGTGCADVR